MVVADRAKAEHFLQQISYYRLRAYWLFYEVPPAVTGDHSFRHGTTFNDVIDLYVFDRRLRLLVLDAIERIEVSLRGAWAHHLAMKYGSHGYADPTHYGDILHFAHEITHLQREINRSKETFIDHYRKKYNDPVLPPVWMTAELISLGNLSKSITLLKTRADRQAIAKIYGIDEKFLISFVHHITYVRNVCAHHARLWNKSFTITMSLPRFPTELAASINPYAPRQLYNALATMAYLLEIVAPNSTWKHALAGLFQDHQRVPAAPMGFPTNWQSLPVWHLV